MKVASFLYEFLSKKLAIPVITTLFVMSGVYNIYSINDIKDKLNTKYNLVDSLKTDIKNYRYETDDLYIDNKNMNSKLKKATAWFNMSEEQKQKLKDENYMLEAKREFNNDDDDDSYSEFLATNNIKQQSKHNTIIDKDNSNVNTSNKNVETANSAFKKSDDAKKEVSKHVVATSIARNSNNEYNSYNFNIKPSSQVKEAIKTTTNNNEKNSSQIENKNGQ